MPPYFLERRVADPGLVLLQDANDMLFAETAYLHRLTPQVENRLTSNRGLSRGAGYIPYRFPTEPTER